MSPLLSVILLHIILLGHSFAQVVPRIKDPVAFLNTFQNECGLASTKLGPTRRPKIFRGKDATNGQFPWMVTLFSDDGRRLSNTHGGCGGSIISDRHVLTAAHCCVDSYYQQYIKWVRVGEFDFRDGKYQKDIPIAQCTIHEHYHSPTIRNDICVIRLQEKIEFNDSVHPICLPLNEPFRNMKLDGTTVEAAGWGLTQDHPHATPPVLKTVTIPIVPIRECSQSFPGMDTKNSICAGGAVNGKQIGTCQGDSGSPLMKALDAFGRKPYFLFGLVSYGGNNYGGGHICDTGAPTVFVKVTQYLDWILSKL